MAEPWLRADARFGVTVEWKRARVSDNQAGRCMERKECRRRRKRRGEGKCPRGRGTEGAVSFIITSGFRVW